MTNAEHVPVSLEIPGLTRSAQSPNGYITSQDLGSKLVIVLVGLPATGKSYIVKKLARFLNWLQHNTRIFNVGERRRKATCTSEAVPNTTPSTAAFFDPFNPTFVSLRDQIAIGTLDELLDWLIEDGGSIGILDATNNTCERRKLLVTHIRERCDDLKILFLESRCFDTTVRNTNIELKIIGPDYVGKDSKEALADFMRRTAHYEKSYVPLGVAEEEMGMPYVQMIDVGRKINTHNIRGYILSQIVEYLLNFNLADRQIWLSCNGESVDDSMGRIGRESDLSTRGQQYARALARLLQQQLQDWSTDKKLNETPTQYNGKIKAEPKDDPDPPQLSQKTQSVAQFHIWTSMMAQTIQTTAAFPEKRYARKQMKMLDDLNAGSMAGLTFGEIAAYHPDEYAARKRDILLYRWPGLGGEGYVDLINRLRPVIVELERTTDDLLLVTHRAVARVLLGYFLGLQWADLGELRIPRETTFRFQINPYGIGVQAFTFDPEKGVFAEVPNSRFPFLPQS